MSSQTAWGFVGHVRCHLESYRLPHYSLFTEKFMSNPLSLDSRFAGADVGTVASMSDD